MDGAIKVGSICQTICTYDHRLAPPAPVPDDDDDDDDGDVNADDDCGSETQ